MDASLESLLRLDRTECLDGAMNRSDPANDADRAAGGEEFQEATTLN
jgi:hypothetical protein